MKSCTCCRTPITVPTCRNVRPMRYDFIYALIAECPTCMSTQAWVIWELSDEQLEELESADKAA